MSTTSSSTIYEVGMIGNNGGFSGAFTPQGDNWTDEFAIALAQALNSITWPDGMSFAVVRYDQVQTNTAVDLTQSPPVFD